MTDDLQHLKLIREADVYKGGALAGHLARTDQGGVRFAYRDDYVAGGKPPVAFSLPLSAAAVETRNGALPPFFAGLLPEGHRLTVLKNAAKTSLDDELSLLLAVGADVPGDVQVVPAGAVPAEPEPLADTSRPEELDFAALANSVDLHGLPGVQDKASASMLTTPLSLRGMRYLLKLDPPENPHLVVNEAAHLVGAKGLKIPVVTSRVMSDRNGLDGLLVERFDRIKGAAGSWVRLPLEDGTQVLGLPPASKYSVTAEDVAMALAAHCQAPVVAKRNAYLQFVFAWLTGNGDLHAKNLSVLGGTEGAFAMAPIYDVPCTLLYGDNTMALSIAGKYKNLKGRHWAEFADSLALPRKAAEAANTLALNAAGSIRLEELPFSGSPLRGAERELRFRRAEFMD
ncbi:HipA-like protein [Arthrobacter sp. ERGS1:01]|uniref:type II toxin-antitoxin system HipA family toxin n=1 Tax=Arthrobacter sp. ERGS1:01 TaxID=1704044 RepID=UPI0006B405A3|nr:HipA domain-containing protein [Arthrobacter sp. ERGS1:01]ALE06126.1 HipA-like protein [Arthrobacter sp. ERGS1:01]